MAAAAGGYALLPGTPVTAPASPATPPPQPGKWADAPPVAVTPYEKLRARLALSLRSTLKSRWVAVGLVGGGFRVWLPCPTQ